MSGIYDDDAAHPQEDLEVSLFLGQAEGVAESEEAGLLMVFSFVAGDSPLAELQ